jgi:hypothetical protein
MNDSLPLLIPSARGAELAGNFTPVAPHSPDPD